MITINTNEGAFKIPTKWEGEALAVHRPVVGFGGKLSKEKRTWTITHIESGLMAGKYNGPMNEAIKLAKAWDQTFKEELPGPEPDAKAWVHKDQWLNQIRQFSPIAAPTSFQAVVNHYNTES